MFIYIHYIDMCIVLTNRQVGRHMIRFYGDYRWVLETDCKKRSRRIPLSGAHRLSVFQTKCTDSSSGSVNRPPSGLTQSRLGRRGSNDRVRPVNDTDDLVSTSFPPVSSVNEVQL